MDPIFVDNKTMLDLRGEIVHLASAFSLFLSLLLPKIHHQPDQKIPESFLCLEESKPAKSPPLDGFKFAKNQCECSAVCKSKFLLNPLRIWVFLPLTAQGESPEPLEWAVAFQGDGMRLFMILSCVCPPGDAWEELYPSKFIPGLFRARLDGGWSILGWWDVSHGRGMKQDGI